MSTPSTVRVAEIAALHALGPSHLAILDLMPIGVGLYEIVDRTDFRLAFINRTARQLDDDAGLEPLGKRPEELMPAAAAAQVVRRLQNCIESGITQNIEDFYQLPHGLLWTISTFVPMRDAGGRITHVLNLWEDVTARKQQELETREQQADIIEHQAATLAELSTPLLAINETTVVMPLIGAVDSRRIQQIMETLLNGVAESRATTIILDITGVPVVDTQVASALIRAAQAVKLLGGESVLTGVRPEVAQTLVGLGVDLSGIVTRGSLQAGIAYALQR